LALGCPGKKESHVKEVIAMFGADLCILVALMITGTVAGGIGHALGHALRGLQNGPAAQAPDSGQSDDADEDENRSTNPKIDWLTEFKPRVPLRFGESILFPDQTEDFAHGPARSALISWPQPGAGDFELESLPGLDLSDGPHDAPTQWQHHAQELQEEERESTLAWRYEVGRRSRI
jgi:hypothetical protein